MNNNPNQPRDYDAVLGGQAPPPVQGAVLGGIEGVKRRLASPMIEARIAAVAEALQYGDAGLELVIEALKDAEKQVRRSAYLLLREREELQVKQALRDYKTWNLVERLDINGYPLHATTFANRKVEEFDSEIGITDPSSTPYALRVATWNYPQYIDITHYLAKLLQDDRAILVEALVFGVWDESAILVDALVAAKEQLPNLKAVFIGDVIDSERQISWLYQSDISPVLVAYPNLEVLQVRGGNGLAFSPVQHENLTAMIVETGGLGRETIAQICALKLPALEHLELWLGRDEYGGDSSIEDLMPILSNQSFPNLTYLGLRNSEYADEIAKALVNAPVLEQIIVLDLSMGTLTDEGALALLNCPAINQLDLLNVSENYLSDEMIQRLSELDVEVRANNQKQEEDYNDEIYRYCSVAE
ncbi:STM4015 family protein [Microseira wollei]|uniref:GUN4 domain protein n=1 Tax=Microseira wollei NIES-4236 TaxID=2530354 RepID=A0AAV3XN86_9CYAN|nr:STM4015 family protein [Microseira wollei]GET41650.1 GUN4 domain protein [Microseira wollei NIES-4236]